MDIKTLSDVGCGSIFSYSIECLFKLKRHQFDDCFFNCTEVFLRSPKITLHFVILEMRLSVAHTNSLLDNTAEAWLSLNSSEVPVLNTILSDKTLLQSCNIKSLYVAQHSLKTLRSILIICIKTRLCIYKKGIS